jgi:hypothetical protein
MLFIRTNLCCEFFLCSFLPFFLVVVDLEIEEEYEFGVILKESFEFGMLKHGIGWDDSRAGLSLLSPPVGAWTVFLRRYS